MDKLITFLLLVSCVPAGVKGQQSPTIPELPPQDGFFNNLQQPEWGAVGSRLLRQGLAAYSDSTYQMAGPGRPNPLDISQHVHSGPGGTTSSFGRNVMSVIFAQLVLDEVLSTGNPGCPPEYENLPIPPEHPLANVTQRPMVYQRSGYDQRTGYSPNAPRQQTNSVTSFIDGGVIYGTSRIWTNHLRAYKDGTLLVDSNMPRISFPQTNRRRLPLNNQPVPRDHTMKPVTRLFAIGNAKGHESPLLLALQVIWHRYHNKIALNIKQTRPALSDEEIFSITRKRVIAHFQKIIVEEWLPAFLNGANGTTSKSLQPYTGYNPQVKPDIVQEFRTAMNFRFSLLPGAVWTFGSMTGGPTLPPSFTPGRGPRNEPRDVTSVRLCNHYWDSQSFVRERLDEILRGMLFTLAEKEDEIVVPDLRAYSYGPFEFSRQDVVAIEIQRDRDHGIGDLNTLLAQYGRLPVMSWYSLSPRARLLQSLYSDRNVRPDDLDLLSGAMVTDDYVNGIPAIFTDIILQQIVRLRDSDRFWYQNNQSLIFDTEELNELQTITFSKVIQETSGLTADELSSVFTCTGPLCVAPPALDDDTNPSVDVCTPLETYDYFNDSRYSFAISLLAVALVVPASYCALVCLAKRRKRHHRLKIMKKTRMLRAKNPNRHRANEWQGPRSGERSVTVEFNPHRKKVLVRDGLGKELRFIDLRQTSTVVLRTSSPSDSTIIALSVKGEVDLILIFLDSEDYQNFAVALRNFLENIGIIIETYIISADHIKSASINRDDRQAVLDEFFRAACLQVQSVDGMTPTDMLNLSRVNEVVSVRLTRTEFADALGMQPSSIFVRNIFLLADTDNDGFISFQEFLGLFAIFLKGSAEEKARLMFNVYDVRRRGILTREDFSRMIRSLLELSEDPTGMSEDSNVDSLVGVMFRDAGIENQDAMSFEDFRKVFTSHDYAATLQSATLSTEGTAVQGIGKQRSVVQRKNTFINSYSRKSKKGFKPPCNTKASIEKEPDTGGNRRPNVRVSVHEPQPEPKSTIGRSWSVFTKTVELYSRHIFWVTLYTLVTCGIFIERAYFYGRGREHAGLRRLSGAWTTAMIRGSASVIMFTYSSLLVTMCRNIITRLRETVLHRFIPFDSAVTFHKYIAVLALIATIVHCVGHGVNLYCVCTQSTVNINCFFREYHIASDKVSTFHYWIYMTITGVAGVLVTIQILVFYVFAQQYARRRVFKAFWLTHSTYPLVYILTFLHGIGRLVQDPLFPWYLIGPLVLFVLDRLTSVSRNKIQIPVLKAELLPSDVLKLVFKRPSNFAYKSGQWVRIACLKLGKEEYHPFTLTSAPHERHLSLHIRAVGPWTTNLRDTYDRDILGGEPYPKLYLDGPFGEGHQDWYTCDVAVLIGGGIGVTPFASILKDIAFMSRTGASITCQKVYFMWVTRTQKSFEWMTDVIREVELTDSQNVVNVHVFVTQFRQKFDLRTTMLYICERHFQKVEGRSLFTGLQATTHFGRPDFAEFFASLQIEHAKVKRIGVFSCGPGPMTSSVQAACTSLNKRTGPTFTHHYENF